MGRLLIRPIIIVIAFNLSLSSVAFGFHPDDEPLCHPMTPSGQYAGDPVKLKVTVTPRVKTQRGTKEQKEQLHLAWEIGARLNDRYQQELLKGTSFENLKAEIAQGNWFTELEREQFSARIGLRPCHTDKP